MDLRTHIGQKLREARKSVGSTQEDFAEALGVSSRTISAIESGHSLPSLATLDLMARRLKRPLAFFFEGFGASDPPKPRNRLEERLHAVLGSLGEGELTLALGLLRALKKHSLEG